MKKSELIDKIKSIVKDLTDDIPDYPEKGDDLPLSRFDLIINFPELGDTLVELMTNDYEQFLKNIYWVAPKPTTFKVILINDQHFFLMYDQRSWRCKVEGKKYYLNELREMELAAEAISRILHYGEISNQSQGSSQGKEKTGEEGNQETPKTPEEEPKEEEK